MLEEDSRLFIINFCPFVEPRLLSSVNLTDNRLSSGVGTKEYNFAWDLDD